MNDPFGLDAAQTPADRRERIRANITMQMLKGFGIAGSVVFGPILFIYLLIGIGTLLPPESKEAVDPTPDSFVSNSPEPQVMDDGS
ncbi:MAG: RC-LH1 core complex protein PufX [Pseudomonadota bacterium]